MAVLLMSSIQHGVVINGHNRCFFCDGTQLYKVPAPLLTVTH